MEINSGLNVASVNFQPFFTIFVLVFILFTKIEHYAVYINNFNTIHQFINH